LVLFGYGTTYCALFLAKTQDIVSAVLKDTPMPLSCQMAKKARKNSRICGFIHAIHRLIESVPSSTCSGGAAKDP
jgi:hypothetical protein